MSIYERWSIGYGQWYSAWQYRRFIARLMSRRLFWRRWRLRYRTGFGQCWCTVSSYFLSFLQAYALTLRSIVHIIFSVHRKISNEFPINMMAIWKAEESTRFHFPGRCDVLYYLLKLFVMGCAKTSANKHSTAQKRLAEKTAIQRKRSDGSLDRP